MSEKTKKTTEPAEELLNDSSSAPSLSGAERMFVRMTLWQTVLSVAGVIIAVAALYAAMKESAAVREQTAAAVWPFVQMLVEDNDSEDSAEFSMSFTNVGVGPAKIGSLRLAINGEPMRNWIHAVDKLGGDTSGSVSRNFFSGRVLSPNDKVVLIRTTDPDLARRFQAAIADPDNFIAYCYCSIFDHCWLADSRRGLQSPEQVEICPDFGNATFEN